MTTLVTECVNYITDKLMLQESFGTGGIDLIVDKKKELLQVLYMKKV